MRLHKFEIKNFKGIEEASFEWDNFAVLIGENNVGKSSVLQALGLFLSGSQIKDPRLCYNHSATEESAVELIGSFDQLTDSDKQQKAISGRTLGDEWILKKKFWCDESDAWKETYFSRSQDEYFIDWPVDTPRTWKVFPEQYQPLIDGLEEKGSRPNGPSLEALKTAIRTLRPELLGLGAPTWVPNPGGGGNWKSNANSILPRQIFVRAVHDASAEATSKESSSYGKILSLIIEKKMAGKVEFRALRRRCRTC